MKILIDADACPVIDLAIQQAKSYKLEVILVADTSHVINKQGAKTIVVDKGSDSADFKLVNMITIGDIVVTQDYGLAAMSLAKGAIPLNQNGLVFNSDNIDSLLLSRHISKKIRQSGGRTKGPKKRTTEQDLQFINSLKKILNK